MEEQPITEHTGFPNPATDQTLASLDISSLLIKHPASTFFMQIEGHGWERYGIFNNDTVIIDRSLTPQGQDLVIFWDEASFRIERFSRIHNNYTLWGVVISTIHRYRP